MDYYRHRDLLAFAYFLFYSEIENKIKLFTSPSHFISSYDPQYSGRLFDRLKLVKIVMAHVTMPVSAGPNVFEYVRIHVPTVPVSASNTFGPALTGTVNTGPKDVGRPAL